MWSRLDDGRKFIALIDLVALEARFWAYLRSRRAPTLGVATLWQVFLRSAGVCVYCRTDAGPYAIDHVTPRVRGGPHTLRNFALACRRCNSRKTYKTAAEFGRPEIQVFDPRRSLETHMAARRRRLKKYSSSHRRRSM